MTKHVPARRGIAATILLWSLLTCAADRTLGDVVIVANRARDKVSMAVETPDGSQPRTLEAGDVITLPWHGALAVRFDSWRRSVRRELKANSIYYFADQGNEIELLSIGLPETTSPEPAADVPRQERKTVSIPVKILVDDEERRIQRIWEPDLRKRFEAASDLLESAAGIRFEIVAAGDWESEDQLGDPRNLWAQFKRDVELGEARLVVGFSHQLRAMAGGFPAHLSDGILGTHILLPEYITGATDADRLDVLLHELGHFLGASHSPESLTVMRPSPGDAATRLRDYRFGFDPLNLLVMNLVADEYRLGPLDNVSRLTPRTRSRMIDAYAALEEFLPDDEYARSIHEKMLDLEVGDPSEPISRILSTVVRRLAPPPSGPTAFATWRQECVRVAADAAAGHDEQAEQAFLLSLGVLFADPRVPVAAYAGGEIASRVANAHDLLSSRWPDFAQRSESHHDTVGHFFLAAYTTATSGKTAARAAAIARNLLRVRAGDGFQTKLLSAEFAGIRFAERVLNGTLPLSRIADRFSTADFLPSGNDLDENLSWSQFRSRYESIDSDAFRELLRKLDALAP